MTIVIFTFLMISCISLHHLNHTLAFVSSLFWNSLMCLCLYGEKNQQIKQYSYALVIQCIADVISATCFYLCSPRPVMVDGEFLFVLTGWFSKVGDVKIFDFVLSFKYIAVSLFPFSMLLVLMCIPISFWYRYNLICM